VLDFNLYLSPNDMWVGVVTATGTGASDPAILRKAGDLSCTDPPIPPTPSNSSNGEPFKNFAYLTGPDSLPGTTLDRTREGYIEIFEMANLTGSAAALVTHPQTVGVAPPCPDTVAIMSYINNTIPTALSPLNLEAPSGGLYGNVTLINVANGADMNYVADALDQYAGGQYYQVVTSQLPLLGGSQVIPSSLTLVNGVAYSEDFSGSPTPGARAVASVFMHSAVLNDYAIEPGVGGQTDWVLTFPIKREFVSSATAIPPFTGLLTTSGACEPALFQQFDRDEQIAPPGQGGFSPTQGTSGPDTGNLCWESTIISFRNNQTRVNPNSTTSAPVSGVLGSRNAIVPPNKQNFEHGWMALTFTGTNATGTGLTSAGGQSLDQVGNTFLGNQTFVGLPVTGFMVRTLTNGAVDCVRVAGGPVVVGGCQGSYGGLFRHAYRSIVR
jgi:hypothetical protein